MQYKGIDICCPACQGELRWHSQSHDEFECEECSNHYPVICGIPDLRLFDDPYIKIQDDREKGRRLSEIAGGHDFPGLVDHYYATTKVVTPQQAVLYKRGLLAAGARSASTLEAWESAANLSPGNLLDVGCGTGPLLVSASLAGYQCVGVDIAFRWLVVARKRLEDANLDVPLLCACAEALPFPPGRFDRVAMDSVIEHTRDQDQVFEQCHSVLADRGALYMTTPNRFSIGPDPHTGFPGGSLYPDKLTAMLVRRQGGLPPRRRLLSLMSLRRKLRQAGLGEIKVFLPDVPAAQRAHFGALLKAAIGIYRLCIRLPLLRQLLFVVGPVICAVSRKDGQAADR